MDVAAAQKLWEPEVVYLNTASWGLPPRTAYERMQATLDEWRAGRATWEQWGEATAACRTILARLAGVPEDRIAVGGTLAEFAALVAASVPDGGRVVASEISFASALFPFMVHAGRGVTVETVPVERVAESITPATDVVVFSAVESSNGQLADTGAILDAAREHDAFTMCDTTQTIGWLPFDASPIDVTICHAYKWLMGPRGATFATFSDRARDRITPLAANWFAGEDVHASYYGPPLRIASTARKFDTSPAWFSWVGLEASLEIVEEIGLEAIRGHDVALANRFLTGLGREPGRSAIVSVDVPAPPNGSSAPTSGPRSVPGTCAPPSTSTIPKPTSTRPSRPCSDSRAIAMPAGAHG